MCKCCDILIEYKKKIRINNKYINGNHNCNSKHLIYIIFCKNCDKTYTGKTTLPLNKRINLHRSQIKHKKIYNFTNKVSFTRMFNWKF